MNIYAGSVTNIKDRKQNFKSLYVTVQAQKPDLVFQRNGFVHLNRRGCQFSRLLAVEVCGSAGSYSTIFSKYVDHSLIMSLQGRKKRVQRSGEREIVHNVYKFMKSESEVGVTIHSKMCESTAYRGGVTSLRLVLRKIGFR